MINKKLFFILLFLCSVALCAGSFFEVYMEGAGKEQLKDLLSSFLSENNNISFLRLFLENAKSWFLIWIILLSCPILPLLAVYGPIICIIKGLSVGFSATMIVESFGLKGIWYILISIVPQNIIQLPITCLLSALSIKMSILFLKFYTQRKGRKKNKNALLTATRHYLIIFIVSFLILLISCLIEAFLKQFVL